MKRRALLVVLLSGTLGLLTFKAKAQTRFADWPKNWRAQDRVLEEQWRSGYRIKQVLQNATAEFEYVE